MSLRVVLVAAFAVVALAAACGGASVPEDPRVREIGSVAEAATIAYAGSGPAGLYDFLAPQLTQRCSRDQFAQNLVDQEVPTGFRGLKKVEFEGDTVRVTVVLIVRDHDRDVEWAFKRGPQDAWYLTEVPGAEKCGA